MHLSWKDGDLWSMCGLQSIRKHLVKSINSSCKALTDIGKGFGCIGGHFSSQ